MTPRRARIIVAGAGMASAVLVVLGLAVAGGPAEARRDHRDAARLAHLREIASAYVCHATAAAGPIGPALSELSPACLSPTRAAELRDPLTGAAYRIEPEARLVRVCADFESANAEAEPYPGAPPFDPATGCVTATLARDPA
jgi:hypothetical protein